VRYLGDEWITAADSALAEAWQQVADKGDEQTTIAYSVKDAPGDDGKKKKVQWTVSFGPDGASVTAGNPEGDPDATMELDYETAVSIARGESSAQVAFMQGSLKLGGDVTLLIRGADHLGEVADALGSLRDSTEF
jgi:putative sterol carrier protein